MLTNPEIATAVHDQLLRKGESLDWLSHRRFLQKAHFRPLFDRAFGRLLDEGMKGAFGFHGGSKEEFLEVFDAWLRGSRLNRIDGLDSFPHRDVISGVTHSLDDLHITFGSRLVCLEKEYAYHRRMNPNFPYLNPSELRPDHVLVIAVPFAWYGDVHPETSSILDLCSALGIPVHVDAAWYGCLREFFFDYSHPAIRSVSFSLSKGLGLGSHRIGVRYSKERHPGPVTVINDFHMEHTALMNCGIRFMRHFGSDYLQERYGESYDYVCRKLNLRPTKALHMAFGEVENGEWWPLGVRPFLRYLVDDINEFK